MTLEPSKIAGGRPFVGAVTSNAAPQPGPITLELTGSNPAVVAPTRAEPVLGVAADRWRVLDALRRRRHPPTG